LSEIRWDGKYSLFVLEVVFLEDEFEFVEIGCENLFWIDYFALSLIFNFKGNTIILREAFRWAEFLFSPEHGVFRPQAEETSWEGDGVLEVGFHLDVASLSNVSLSRSIAYHTGSLSKVGFVGDNLHASSFGHCYFTGPRSKINPDGSTNLLIAH
jgi:hypothetical protein